jgi:tetratricopeptide (TPR) repeat protein
MGTQRKLPATAKYFEILGLPLDATGQDIEARYQELSGYLASGDVPPELKQWASEQAGHVDEAYAVLSDPDLRAGLEDEGEAEDETRDEPAEAAASAPARSETADKNEAAKASSRFGARLPLIALAVGILVGGAALLAVIVAEMGFGGEGSEDPATVEGPDEQFVPVDTERVAELITSYQDDPTNPETLFELGEAYFLAGDWQQGQEWFLKLVEVDPENVHAWTDIGTSHYNLGRAEEAQAAWQTALDLAPEDPQLHYNMGFLYANTDPPDFDAAMAEWQLVLDLAPGTQLAQTVEVHMEGFESAADPEAAPVP